MARRLRSRCWRLGRTGCSRQVEAGTVTPGLLGFGRVTRWTDCQATSATSALLPTEICAGPVGPTRGF